MWTDEFESMMMLMVMAALMRLSYELTRQGNAQPQNPLLAETVVKGTGEDPYEGLQPWQKEASEKAVSKYADAQPKKWRRWNESMFEPVK